MKIRYCNSYSKTCSVMTISLWACAMLHVTGQANAGTTFQGTTFQGSGLQAAGPGGPSTGDSLEILAFRGDVVDIAITDGRSGQSRVMPIHASKLVGMQWMEAIHTERACLVAYRRIVEAAPDPSFNTMPRHRDNRDVWLYRVEYTLDPEKGGWSNVCDPETNDIALGLFVNGSWSQDGSWSPEGHTFSCQRGVVAKCVRGWGYKPWKSLTTADGVVVDLAPLHQACTRAARADYAGDGVSYTRDGVLVDMFDIHGFNVPEYPEGFVEEARFDLAGAVSVHHARLVESDFDVAGFQPDPSRAGNELVQVWSRTDTHR